MIWYGRCCREVCIRSLAFPHMFKYTLSSRTPPRFVKLFDTILSPLDSLRVQLKGAWLRGEVEGFNDPGYSKAKVVNLGSVSCIYSIIF